MQIAELGEVGLIDRIDRAARRLPRLRGLVQGIGDDAALLRAGTGDDVVVSTDACVEGVHFRWRTQAARTVGRRALAAALSDLAAMGARPLGFTFALAAPRALSLARFDGLVAGLLHEARAHACPLIGGNVTRARETSLVLTVMGAVLRGRALRRRARVGDRILVTGTLGSSALAIARAERGGTPVRHVPVPRLHAGRVLGRTDGVRGCIDVSDGLEVDLGHLVGSGRHLPLDPARVPVPRGFPAACARLGLDPARISQGGGEDYELLFAVRPRAASAASFARRLGVRVTELGRVARGAGPRAARGWRHF